MSDGLGAPVLEPALRSVWRPGRPIDVRATLGPLLRGDAHLRLGPDGVWWATRTPQGPGTIFLKVRSDSVESTAWGAGAGWLIEQVPLLFGVDDDWSQLDLSTYPRLADVARRHPGLRLPSTGRLFESVVPAVLEQRVTGGESRRSWQALIQQFGETAPGPDPTLRVPPTTDTLLAITDWQWHRLGVEHARQRPIRAAATVANHLEKWGQSDVLERLCSLPGIGPWTAAEAAQRAFGHPDAVSVGDFHLHDNVVYALTGQARGTDDEMLALLAEWPGQRQRVVRLIELAGVVAPRFGPRYRPLNVRAM